MSTRVSDLPATLIASHKIFHDSYYATNPFFLDLRIVLPDLRYHVYVVETEFDRLEV